MVPTTRLEAFSDGVFAIVITLLAIDLRAPEVAHGASLVDELVAQWPNYVAYALSFLVVGVMWLNHHRVLDDVKCVDGLVLALNLGLLLWVVLIPFPTETVATFLRAGGANARTAVALYGGVVLAAALSFSALYMALTRPSIVAGRVERAAVRRARRRFGLGIGVYGLALALAWISPVASLVAHGTMAAYYASRRSSSGAKPRYEHM
jgi:uncharacterized membrane protein